MRRDAFNDYRQVESLLSLFATLKPDVPLPPLRDHSASPDFLRRAVLIMLERRPRVLVELGSGSSTVFLALCLKRLGEGKLVSIDHDEVFAERTRAMLVQHDLTDYACVLYRPLKPVRIDGAEYIWYSIDDFKPPGPVEMLIVDGPPYHVHTLARYPALPMMLPFMADNCTVLLDDANRPEEIRIASLWKKNFAEFS